MSTVNIVLLVILPVLIVGLIVLYFLGKKAQKKRDEQEAQLAANAQTVSMLIIDKKRMRLKDSGLPQVVIDQTPKMMRHSKRGIIRIAHQNFSRADPLIEPVAVIRRYICPASCIQYHTPLTSAYPDYTLFFSVFHF